MRTALLALVGPASIYLRLQPGGRTHAEAARSSALANTTDEEAKAAIQAAVDAELQRRTAASPPPPPLPLVAR